MKSGEDCVRLILDNLKENEVLLGGSLNNGKKRYTEHYSYSTYINPDGTKSIDRGYLQHKFARVSSFKNYTGKNDVWITKKTIPYTIKFGNEDLTYFYEIAVKIS